MHNQPQAETDWDYLDKLVHKADNSVCLSYSITFYQGPDMKKHLGQLALVWDIRPVNIAKAWARQEVPTKG